MSIISPPLLPAPPFPRQLNVDTRHLSETIGTCRFARYVAMVKNDAKGKLGCLLYAFECALGGLGIWFM